MALRKSITLKNGIYCPDAYHAIVEIKEYKIPSDIPDPGARPADAPDYLWRAGYYANISLHVWLSELDRQSGKKPIAFVARYPTGAGEFDIGTAEWIENQDLVFAVDTGAGSASLVEQAYSYLQTLEMYAEATQA